MTSNAGPTPPPLPPIAGRPSSRLTRGQKGLIAWGVLLGLGIPVAFVLLRVFVLHPFKVPTNAMKPTIMGVHTNSSGQRIPGDHIFAEKLSHRAHHPQRGDIVVFRTSGIDHPAVPRARSVHFVKRVAGIPGDTVRIDPPYVLINGAPLTNPPVFRMIAEGQSGYPDLGYRPAIGVTDFKVCLGSTSNEVTLRENEYLVLGDNTASSLDGRYYGPIKQDAIVGRVVWTYYPFDRMGRVR